MAKFERERDSVRLTGAARVAGVRVFVGGEELEQGVHFTVDEDRGEVTMTELHELLGGACVSRFWTEPAPRKRVAQWKQERNRFINRRR